MAGLGVVSEKAEFAELCDRLGITFVGPSAQVMRRLGDKIESKRLAEQVGVPLAAWSSGPVADLEQARARAEIIGYPLMVKASAGGGGRGIRLVNSSDELDEAFERASSEALKCAGKSHDVPGAGDQRRQARRGADRRAMATARYGHWACGTAASSGATRR